ncbi:hypothetical protein [Aliiroseovarius subalbicans]|uniref:hypothetical protein n=1 Tax=Aliiroseovarius subalbicans TaxID=2925840 RepID=UPI001F580699|nr:hypothetical protein [Aliiroseovarius subalbicans]MCI2400290.1 hypothetical protein [Aliiroseovarius subalbicans]
MKTTFLTVSALALMTGIASAETGFQYGAIDFDAYGFGANDSYAFNLTARGAFDLGSMGLQVDGRVAMLTDFTDSDELYSVGAHLYTSVADGHRLGGYLGYSHIPTSSRGIVFAGAEGLFDLGAVDVEASLGVMRFTSGSSPTFANVGLTAMFDVAPNVELSATYAGLFPMDAGPGGQVNAGLLKATYYVPNSAWSMNATLGYTDGNDTMVYGLGLSYAFGAQSVDRLFTPHDLNIAHLGGGT